MLIQKHSQRIGFSPTTAYGILDNKIRIKYDDYVRTYAIQVFSEKVVVITLDFFLGFKLEIMINEFGLAVHHQELDMTYRLYVMDGESERSLIEGVDELIEGWIGNDIRS